MREASPDLAEQVIGDWLETGVQTIVSENETFYYDVAQNYLSAHPGLRREAEGMSVDMDVVAMRVVMQYPAVVSDTATYDIDLINSACFRVDLTAVGE
ncbi:MAG: hypothetical protein M0P17_00725 [Methanoculleus sp.]|nr:hypothetical protein [Methanoculleus sp.]